MLEKPPVESESAPEAELVERARGGDLSAFETLIAKYERAVFNIALYKSKNYFDAEDLSQDIFLAAFRALETLKTPESFGGWLFGIGFGFLLWMITATTGQIAMNRPLATGGAAQGVFAAHLLFGLALGIFFPPIHRLLQARLKDVDVGKR